MYCLADSKFFPAIRAFPFYFSGTQVKMQSFQRPCLFRGGPRQILSQIVQTRSSPEETARFPSIPAKREEKKKERINEKWNY